MRIILVSLLILVVLAACLRPPLALKLDLQGASILIDLQTLGEYPTAIRRIQLAEAESGRIVWEVEADEGQPQLWRFSLESGENMVNINAKVVGGTFRVVVPADEASFDLEPSTGYLVTVWGKSPRPASESFVFPGRNLSTKEHATS